jgi:ABC-type sugar transport system ATPase subunit
LPGSGGANRATAFYRVPIERMTKFLSGGTQQKVVLAKWLCTQSRFLIFDERPGGSMWYAT